MAECNQLTPLPFKGLMNVMARGMFVTSLVSNYAAWWQRHTGVSSLLFTYVCQYWVKW